MNEKVRKILIRYIEEISCTDEWVSEDILDHIIEEVEAAKRGENEHYKKPELVLKDYGIKACWDWAFNITIESINE